jgi:beta-lactamase class A
MVSPALSCFLLSLICSATAFGQLDAARVKIDSIALHAKGLVGVAAIDLDSGDTLTICGNGHFPMQSVYKFPLALAVLDQVDKGTLALWQTIHISKADLLPDTWSPLRETYPSGGINLPLDTLLKYTVSLSDNNGCDILFRLLGGTSAVDRYVHKLGIVNMSVVATEVEMHQGWDIQYRNWSSPLAMAKLLQLFRDGGILSQGRRDYLWQLMASSGTAPRRIKGLLPSGTVVPHKSGSSGTNDKGVAAATNDIGIIVFPEGRCVALVVFVSNSNAPDEEREMVIAAIALAVWDAYSPQ